MYVRHNGVHSWAEGASEEITRMDRELMENNASRKTKEQQQTLTRIADKRKQENIRTTKERRQDK